ncbi:Predicted transcriptional regulator, ArsR family [Nitrosomonas sp. Nm51]|uniref:helix-turn-helix transcriptional regulator n=1 Tax=Nitrosomonas sp. Nm51 TaxID=133720 RepID=UPI0008D50CDD|nr:HTH domain-containing protein [Nitrosomonas sp. Nm51]SER17658.1 Predicted transcriptional regulator, ArsR family [Nitrosomonas sp. Nm51]
MSAILHLGQRQQALLTVLLHHRNGLTIDELAGLLEISRNAINQHLSSLSASGFIQSALLHSTGGRPGKVYTLTPNGLELFPRHYALLASTLLAWLKKNLGEKELESCLTELGRQFALEFTGRVDRHQAQTDKVNEVAAILRELGYDTDVTRNSEFYAEITANNCVYHRIAEQCHKVCALDLSLLTSLLNADITHKTCIVKGGKSCCFGVLAKTSPCSANRL